MTVVRSAPLFALLLAAALPAAEAVDLRVAGMSAPGRIDWDADGVPHIRAANENDAAFLLGYAHARDRLFQMDLNRRAAQGRVAELLGQPALASDVQIRTLGLDRAARRSWSALSADTRGWLRSYAMGVNAWVDENDLPREYGLLEITRFERWTPYDSVSVMKLLSFQLSFTLDIDFTLRYAAYVKAGQQGGFDGAALFFEDTHRTQPADGRVTFPQFHAGAGKSRKNATETVHYDEDTLALARAYRDSIKDNPLIAPTLDPANHRGGSNWWVIAGKHMASGKPFIANDPHLPLGIPTTFHEAHIVGGDTLDVTGIGMPGVPALAFGCTPRQCWSIATNHMDVTDTYEETLVFNSYGLPTHTVHKGQAEPVDWTFQSYTVNRLDGVADNAQADTGIGYLNGGITITVPRRNNGPIVTMAGGKGLSVQFAGWGATKEIEALRRMNRVANLEQMHDALTYLDFGSVNVGYADVDGNIAGFTTGEQPLREDLQTLERADGVPPFLIRDGSGARRHEWLPAVTRQVNQALPYEVLPAQEMPHAINPAVGYLANGNNDPSGNTLDNDPTNDPRAGGGSLYLAPYYSAFRVGRIDRLIQNALVSGKPITYEMARDWQANTQQLDAEIFMPHLLGAADRAAAADWAPLRELMQDARMADAIARLRAWDFSAPTGIREGYDAGDDPAALAEPSALEIDRSVAATVYAGWRSQMVRTVIDGTLQRAGVSASAAGSGTPSNIRELLGAIKFHLEGFAQRRGYGVSGLDFFAAEGAPTREAARDFVMLRALREALDRYASDEFAPAFGNSRELRDYRWGKLHRIALRHPLRGPFDLPSPDGLHGFTHLSPQLPGVARDGGYETVNDGEHEIRASTANGFMFSSGVIFRLAAEMSVPVRAQEIVPGGQSADITSPHYADQFGRWLTQRYRTMPLAGAASAHGLSFEPRESGR